MSAFRLHAAGPGLGPNPSGPLSSGRIPGRPWALWGWEPRGQGPAQGADTWREGAPSWEAGSLTAWLRRRGCPDALPGMRSHNMRMHRHVRHPHTQAHMRSHTHPRLPPGHGLAPASWTVDHSGSSRCGGRRRGALGPQEVKAGPSRPPMGESGPHPHVLPLPGLCQGGGCTLNL